MDLALRTSSAGCRTRGARGGRRILPGSRRGRHPLSSAAADPHARPTRKPQELLRGLQLDVVHDMGLGWYCDVFQPHGGSRTASFEQNLLGSPGCALATTRLRWLPRYRQFERSCSTSIPTTVACSWRCRKWSPATCKRYQGVRPDSICIVYNGVDLRRFHPQHQAVHRDRVRSELGLADDVPLFLIVAHNLS